MNQNTVLIVDDEEPMLRTIDKLLSAMNCVAYPCTNAAQALEVLQNNDIDVVLCDHHLQDLSGFELLRRIRGISPGTVRILMTGWVEQSLSEQAIGRGDIFAVLGKPFGNQRVEDMLSEALQYKASCSTPSIADAASGA